MAIITDPSLSDWDQAIAQLEQLESWTSWKQEHKLASLEASSFIEAMLHRSLLHELPEALAHPSYERLEFLGDAVVQHLMSHLLFERYPQFSEGELSKLRGALVNQEALATLARYLNLGDWLLLGRGEDREKGREKESILSDCFESLLGALSLKLDFNELQGWFAAFLERYKASSGEDFLSPERGLRFDPKSELQEKTMALYQEVPVYDSRELEDQQGFEVRLIVCGSELVRGQGPSKKGLMKSLARKVLDHSLYKSLNGEDHAD